MSGFTNTLGSNKGQTTLLLTLMFVLVGMIMGLAVDGGITFLMRARLNKVVDAATIAGAKGVFGANSEAEALAQATAAACDSARLNGLGVEGPAGTCPPGVTVVAGDLEVPNVGPQLGVIVTATDSRNTSIMRLGALFGCSECKTSTVQSRAAASFTAVLSVDTVPVALRSREFGAVDPNIPWRNPGKLGPSAPGHLGEDGPTEQFDIGEQVYLGSYGTGVQVGVSMVLDINEFGYQNNYVQILKGHQPGVSLSIGDELFVVQEGRSNHATHLDDRLYHSSEGDLKRIVIVPITEIIEDGPHASRDPDGTLGGKVRVVEFVAVRLEGSEWVYGEDAQTGNQTKSKHLYGTIIKWEGTNVTGTRPPNPVAPVVSVGVAVLVL